MLIINLRHGNGQLKKKQKKNEELALYVQNIRKSRNQSKHILKLYCYF